MQRKKIKRKRNLLAKKRINRIIKILRKNNSSESTIAVYKWLLCEFKDDEKKFKEIRKNKVHNQKNMAIKRKYKKCNEF